MLLFVGGCGYKPSSHYTQNIFDQSVYADVKVSRAEPENAAYIRDELQRMIIRHFGGRMVSKEQAQSVIIASYEGSSFNPAGYDASGYITSYQVVTRVHFAMKTRQGALSHTITSITEASLDASTLVSSRAKTEALRKGLEKALDEFLAYAIAKGALSQK